MSTINDGGPAFPMARVTVLAEDGTPNEACAVSHDGMTLRDYFAAKAMQSLLTTIDEFPDERWRAGVAMDAYMMADAMLAARKADTQQ